MINIRLFSDQPAIESPNHEAKTKLDREGARKGERGGRRENKMLSGGRRKSQQAQGGSFPRRQSFRKL